MIVEHLTKSMPKQDRAMKTEEALLDALEGLLANSASFDDVNVKAICERAGCTTGAFYGRYTNKSSLLLHLFIKRISRIFVQEVANSISTEKCRDMDPQEIVATYLRAHYTLYTKYCVEHMAVAKHVRYENPDPKVLQAIGEYMAGTVDCLKARLFDRIDFIRHPNPEAAVRIADSSASNTVKEFVFARNGKHPSANEAMEVDELIEELATMVVAYLGVGREQETAAFSEVDVG